MNQNQTTPQNVEETCLNFLQLRLGLKIGDIWPDSEGVTVIGAGLDETDNKGDVYVSLEDRDGNQVWVYIGNLEQEKYGR